MKQIHLFLCDALKHAFKVAQKLGPLARELVASIKKAKEQERVIAETATGD